MNQNSKSKQTDNSPGISGSKNLPQSVWSWSKEKILQHFNVSADKGLSQAEAKKRLGFFGLNRLQKAKKKSVGEILANQFKSLIIIVLAVATGVSFVLGDWIEGIAIGIAIILFVIIGFVT